MFLTCPVPDLVKELEKSLKDNGIIPDIVDCYPEIVITTHYVCQVAVQPACVLTTHQVRSAPSIRWLSYPNKLYTMLMIDPDTPSRKSPTNGQFLHWLIGNVPGCDIIRGDQIVEYVGSHPEPNTGFHRYIFVVFKQHCQLDFDEPYLSNRTLDGRNNFNVKTFAKKYALGKPVAINFFLAKYEKREI